LDKTCNRYYTPAKTLNMVVYSVFIVSKSGGLIFDYEQNVPQIEVEKTFPYPLELDLKLENKRICVNYGQGDGIMIGHVLLTVNGQPVVNGQLEDGREILEMIKHRENFPISLKFGRPKITTNEKIFLASMFYPLYAIAIQLSPEP